MRGPLVAWLVVVLLGVVGSASVSAGPVAGGWTLRELDPVPGRRSVATAVNAAGVVVGAHHAGEGYWLASCYVGFLRRPGRTTLKQIGPSGCSGDMWSTSAALDVTPGGRVIGEVFCSGCLSGTATYWVWPASANPTPGANESWAWDPAPAAGPSRTCLLTPAGGTRCVPFLGLPATPGHKMEEARCGAQDLWGLALNDRTDVIAYLYRCEVPDTGEVLGADSYYLAGPGGLVNFGPRGTAVIAALNARGHVAGGIGVPGGSHAFLWDGRRIVDLGTLGGTKSQAAALNDRSQVAGWSTTRGGQRHGFLWAGGRMTDLGQVVPLAVNGQGTVLSTRMEGKRLHAFLWRNGRTADLGYWRALGTEPGPHFYGLEPRPPLALDDAGRIAGTDEQGHAAVWEQGRRTRLPELPGAKTSAALDVDARGGIAGWSGNARGQTRAVLWTKRS